MPTAPVRKRLVRSRAPVKITRVGSPSLPPAKSTAPAKRSKVFSHLADGLAQLAGVIKGVREREREGKIAAGTANKLAAQLANFMETAEELSAAEAKARLNAIQDEATKAVKAATNQPAARVISAVSASQATGMRAAFGLRTPDAGTAARAAREMTQHRQRAAAKAEGAQQGHPGRPVDIPAAAAPVFVDRPNPQVTEYIPGGSRLPTPLVDQAVVYAAVIELFVAADNRAVVLLVSELSAMTGLNAEAVNVAIVELERRRLLTRQPGRAGSVQLWAPASLVNVARD